MQVMRSWQYPFLFNFIGLEISGGSGPRSVSKLGEDMFGLCAQVFKRTVVTNDEVGERNFLLIGDLCSHAAACIGFKLLTRRRTGKLREAVDITCDAQVDGRSNENNFVEAAAPAGCRTLPVGFEDKSRLDDSDGMRIFRKNSVGPLLLGSDDRGMDDMVQLGEPIVAKSEISEQGTVERAVSANDTWTEVLDDSIEDGLTGSHKVACDGVCFNDMRPERAKELCDGGLSAAKPACESNSQHRGLLCWCLSGLKCRQRFI